MRSTPEIGRLNELALDVQVNIAQHLSPRAISALNRDAFDVIPEGEPVLVKTGKAYYNDGIGGEVEPRDFESVGNDLCGQFAGFSVMETCNRIAEDVSVVRRVIGYTIVHPSVPEKMIVPIESVGSVKIIRDELEDTPLREVIESEVAKPTLDMPTLAGAFMRTHTPNPTLELCATFLNCMRPPFAVLDQVVTQSWVAFGEDVRHGSTYGWPVCFDIGPDDHFVGRAFGPNRSLGIMQDFEDMQRMITLDDRCSYELKAEGSA